ncbi:MAG: hypothetical protein HQL48_08130 [Gammaproteobacteria bacterium]|nr:hypothetical protein [Gammaproteobacteria bacterium]
MMLTNLQAPNLHIPFVAASAPNPYTFAMSVGSITDQLTLNPQGEVCTRKVILIGGSSDHAIMDGYPITQIAATFSHYLHSGLGLDDAFVDELRQLQAGAGDGHG